MRIGSPRSDKWGERLLDVHSERLIAGGRVVLTLFAFIALTIDPSTPNHYTSPAYLVTLLYLAFAVVACALALKQLPSKVEQGVSYAADVLGVSVLLASTEGATSPFFVFFTFILLASTIRWNWRGALVTSALLIATYAGLSIFFRDATAEPLDLTRAIIRAAFLMVAGLMLGYVGAYRERSRTRLTQLVGWPGPDPEENETDPPIASAMRHAAKLMRASRILVIWEQAEEPSRQVAYLSGGEVRHSREPPSRFGDLISPQDRTAPAEFSCSTTRPGERNRLPALAMDPDLQASFGIGNGLVARFRQLSCSGTVFALDTRNSSDADLLLVELIAGRIGVDLEHFVLRQKIKATAALAERSRLGQDLHDGLLQTLTAVNIRLKLQAGLAPAEVAANIEETRELLLREQQRVRNFVEEHRPNPKAPGNAVDLISAVRGRLTQLGRQWRCEVSLDSPAADLKVSPTLARHVLHLLDETVSNAARHGPASVIGVALAHTDASLVMSTTDNGSGFRGLAGAYADDELRALNIGPASLRSRVAQLGGTLALDTSSAGSRVEIRLPL